MTDSKKKKTIPKPEPTKVFSEHAKLIPKFATKIAAARAEDNYIISFVSELPDEQAQMIERIVLTEKIVDDLMELLKNLKEQ
jgi:hypothetical protein